MSLLTTKRIAVIVLALLTCAPVSRAETKELLVFILAGQSNMEGHGTVEMGRVPGDEADKPQQALIENGVGSLRRFVNDNQGEYGAGGKAPLIDKEGKWLVRDDVYVYYQMLVKNGPSQIKKGHLSTGFGIGTKIGPEFGFGHVIGNATQSPVLIIKTAWGGKDLAVDFRPPSSGETPLAKDREVGAYYKEMLAIVKNVMASVDTEFPALKGYTPRLAGFGWHQGWNDGCSVDMVNEYEKNMCNFINDVRKDLGVKDLPFVIANSGQQGFGYPWSGGRRKDLCEFQLAVGDPSKHPEFKGTVASVETRDFCRLIGKSPSSQGYHWHQNGESYFLVGKGIAEAMLDLIKGTGGEQAK